MVDIFGLEKDPRAPRPAAGPAPAAGGGRQRLWAALLALDSIFVVIFGGAVAAKIYQHLNAPAAPASVPSARRRPGKIPVASAVPAANEVAATKPAQQAHEETKAPATAAPAGPIAKPSLLAEPVKARQAPQPQAAAAASAPPPATAGEKRHSVPVEFKLKAPRARSVKLVGAFIVRGGRREMVQQDEGHWTMTLYLLPGNSYRYWFLVDGKKTLDPDNNKVDRRASVLSLP